MWADKRPVIVFPLFKVLFLTMLCIKGALVFESNCMKNCPHSQFVSLTNSILLNFAFLE